MNSIYDLTIDDLKEITKQAADNNMIVYDCKSRYLSERLMYLIQTIFTNNYDTNYTHLIIPPKTNISKVITKFGQKAVYTKTSNAVIIGKDEWTDKELISFDCYETYMKHYMTELNGTLVSNDSNLAIAINAKRFQTCLRTSVLIASF
jgi:hypothetical protein